MLDWKPPPGQVALIEPTAGAQDCLTGVVVDNGGGAVVIDLGGSPRPTAPECAVVASFFTPDALYRADATATPHEGTDSVIDLVIHGLERVQRRASPRVRVVVPVVLSNLDDPDPDAGGGVFASVTGESVDIGEGGCCVAVDQRFPQGCDPTVILHLSPMDTLVALAAVLEEQPRPDGRYEYRLVFTDPDDDHRERLAKVVANALSAA